MIGANNENNDNLNGGGPQGHRMTTNASDPLVEAMPNQDERSNFACGLCDAHFTTNIGRGQHMRHAHIEAYNASLNIERVKARWSKEETEIMAYEEAQASLRGDVVFMNQHLSSVVAHRTVESIKGKRRQIAYKEIVRKYIEDGLEREVATSGVISFDSNG